MAERLLRAGDLGVKHVRIGRAVAGILRDPARHHVARNAAEHRRIGDAVAAEAVRAMHAARVLAGDEKAKAFGRGLDVADHAAHEIVRGRHHFDQAAGEIEAAIAAAIDHAFELLRHLRRTEMAHLDIDAAILRRAAGFHLGRDGAADDIARGAFELCVIVAHEAMHRAIEQMSAGTA